MKRFALATFLICASIIGLAYAGPSISIDPVGRWVKGPLSVGTRGAGATANTITQSLATVADVNLGSVDGGCFYGAVALSGARAGDACFASIYNRTLLADAGYGSPYLPGPAGVSPTCFAGADTVTLVSCGVADPPDAGYAVRVFSSQ